MKRALAWFAGLVGIAALGRWLARRQPARGEAPEPARRRPRPRQPNRRRSYVESSPETREPYGGRAWATAAEPESLDERRERVHAKAREAIEAMADDGQAS